MRTCDCIAHLLAIAALAVAVPASAQPGMTAPTNPPTVGPGAGAGAGAGPAGGGCNACGVPVERQGPFVSFGLDAAPQGVAVGDLLVGVMVAPWIGVFVSLDTLVTRDDEAPFLWGAGLRMQSGIAFAEARILSVTERGECDEGCGDGTRLVQFGLGVDVIHSEHVALDVHLHVLSDGRNAVPLAGFGLGFHY